MVTNEELFENYKKRLGGAEKTRNHYLRFAGEYIKYAAGKEHTRETIDGFLADMQERYGYGQGSINFIFRVIRTMFNRSKADWPYNRGEAPVIRESDVNAPALDPRTIKRMIAAVRVMEDVQGQAYFLLSTLYGLREEEMINLNPGTIHLADRTLYIATAKHGRERNHLIPEEAVPYFAAYDFSEAMSPFKMLNLWYQLESYIQLRHIHRVGWHSVRRTLVTLLLQELPEISVKSFMRWKQRTSSDMAFRYSATKFVGEEESVVAISGEALTVDKQVMAKHPFLGDWA